MSLANVWDGEMHWLEPGEFWTDQGATLVIDGWEELEEEDELSPLESPSRTPILRETRTVKDNPKFPLARLEQAWGALSIALTAFASIAGASKKQYQHVWPGPGSVKEETRWSFKSDEFVSERL